MPLGRPDEYERDMAFQIADEYGRGAQWPDILGRDGRPKNVITLLEWAEKYPDFAAALVRARAAHGESLVAQMVDIAATQPDPQRARVMIDTRKWIASKFSQQFADRVELAVSHSVDLSAAIDQARNRLAHSQHTAPTIDAQAIDNTALLPSGSTDAASVEAPKAPDALPDWLD
ncbi:MAG: hypothetical protein ACK515_02555 [bacterium]